MGVGGNGFGVVVDAFVEVEVGFVAVAAAAVCRPGAVLAGELVVRE
jgi:hypothetical protein